MTETDRTDGRGSGRAIASIVAASAVGLLTSSVAWSFLVGASWSAMHGGMPVIVLVGLSVFGMALPPALGVLAGWAVHRSWPEPQQWPTPKTDSVRLTCPHCGCSMKQTAEYSATPAYTVVQCPI